MKRALTVAGVVGGFVVLWLAIGYVSFHALDSTDPSVTSPTDKRDHPDQSRVDVESVLDSLSDDTRPTRTNDKASTDAPRVAIVIDDLGWNIESAPFYDDIDVPLTMAVLPGRPRSLSLYNRWKDQFEFIVHMPMEPEGYPEDDPGELALMTSMSTGEVRTRLQSVLDRYPRAVGINNHMGSAFTKNSRLMGVVMETLADNNLYYFDSGTTQGSTALRQAKKAGVPAIENQVFLDHRRNEAFITDQLNQLASIAREEGEAVGIGHVQSMTTARVLRSKIPRLRKQGIRFVPLSEMIGVPELRARR